MEEKRKGGKVVESVWALAEPRVTALGLILWDVKYVKEGVNRYLRIVIDKPGGVGLNDCIAVNEALDGPLDELILKLRVGFESKKIWRCVLRGYEDGALTAEFPDGSLHTFEKNAYVSVKADDFDDIG